MMRRFKLVAVISFVAAIGLSLLASRVQADAHLLDAFDEEEEVAIVTRTLENKLQGSVHLKFCSRPKKVNCSVLK